jgi:hypothetical protein
MTLSAWRTAAPPPSRRPPASSQLAPELCPTAATDRNLGGNQDQLGTWRRLKLGPHRVDVSYGSLGGARAIEHLRAICSELQIAHVRQQLSFSLFTDFVNFSLFNPAALHDDAAGSLFEQLETWVSAMKSIRSSAHGAPS